MLGRISIILLFIFSAASLSATKDKTLSQTELKAALTHIATLNADTETVSADFISESSSSLSRNPIRTNGRIRLTRNGNLHMSVDADGETEDFIYNATKASVTFISGGTRTEIKDPTGGIGISMMRLAGPLIDSELLKNYNVNGTRNASFWILTLSPKARPLNSMIKSIKITVSQKNGTVTNLCLTMPDGSETRYRFTNIRLGKS